MDGMLVPQQALGSGNGVGATFDALPQLAAEAKGSGGAEDGEGTRNLISIKT